MNLPLPLPSSAQSSSVSTPTRRQFLATAATAGSLLILPHGLRGQGTRSPNERLRIAQVGVGGRGGASLAGLADEQFVALCDVDEKRSRSGIAGGKKAGPPAAQLKDAKWFKDFRVMFEQMEDKIDAVAIATPDHMHFPIAMAAIAR
ncbi:MAG: Gfo/Idh/MocA family oxidoreductase, partial [Opitutaceae bacterium]|nr:Gfo/Idh/MocA family oxidoreductase [Opitutaceae bacterium]